MYIANRKKKSPYSLFLIIILLVGCSIITPKKDKTSMLYENIRRLENIQMEGVAEIKYNNLALRKEIFVTKKSNKLSAILIDGGILGMQATPFASLEIAEKTTFSFAGKKESSPFSFSQLQNLTSTQFIEKYKSEIISKQYIQIGDYHLTWNDDMQLIKISGENIEVRISYNISGDLDEININLNNEIEANILIDKV
jgi:hypothetical protein